MGGMTNISDTAKQAQADARRDDGRFGMQVNTFPEVRLNPPLHPDESLRRLNDHKARHEVLTAAGAFATPYDNVHVMDFEDEHPHPTHDDIVEQLFDLPFRTDEYGEPLYDDEEREKAAAEFSRRAAAGLGGVLTRADDLRRGDVVTVDHLGDHVRTPGEHPQHAVVVSPDSSNVEGGLLIRLDDDSILSVPYGTVLPALGYRYRGTDYAASALVAKLIRDGELTGAARTMDPREAVHQFTEANALGDGDTDYPQQIVPLLSPASPKWCLDDSAHGPHQQRNDFGDIDTCTGIAEGRA